MGIIKKKEAVLTTEEKLNKAKGEATSALIMFQQARDSLQTANQAIDEAVAEMDNDEAALENQLLKLRERRAGALKDKAKNAEVDAKLADFIN
ncbi:hypothetical protein P59_139 [Bacillus phage P59]|nr:hypothetical protein P59_139 [Bacillus phage P59]